jgi:hypothetical protein
MLRRFSSRFSVSAAIPAAFTLPLISTSASGADASAFHGLIPDFYSQSSQVYPQALQLETQSSPTDGANQSRDPPYKFIAKFNSTDVAQQMGGLLQGFSFRLRNWQQNKVEDVNLSFSSREDWVQLSIKQSQTVYAADPNYLLTLASRNKNKSMPGKERFLFQEGAEGSATLQRLDTKIVESNLFGLSAFAFHNDVDPTYESLASDKAKDEFATANRSSDAAGAKFRLGSFSLTASYTSSSRLVGVATPTEAREDYTIGFDLGDFRKRSGELFPPLFWDLAPSTVYAGSFSKETSYKLASQGPPDRTTGYGAGAYWGWNGGSANVSSWTYYLDSNRVGDASYDSAGRGFDASIGGYRGLFGLYGGVSYHHSDDLAPVSRAFDHGYDAYTSFSYKPPRFPDIALEGAFGRYGYDSLIWGVTSDAAYWSATLGFDFGKFLWDSTAVKQQSATSKSTYNGSRMLKVFYRYYNETDNGIVGATPGDSHLLGIIFRTGLN